MKQYLIYFCAYLLINNAHAGEIIQCTSIKGWDADSAAAEGLTWSGTPASNVSHTDLQITRRNGSAFHDNIRIISTCTNIGPDILGTMTDELQQASIATSPVATTNPIHCWCKMIRPFATQWFHSNAYWINNKMYFSPRSVSAIEKLSYNISSINSCLYNCPYWCATYLIEQNGLPDDVIDWLADKRQTIPKTQNNCNMDIPWTVQHIQRSGVGFEENCTEIGGIVIPTDNPVKSCKSDTMRDDSGTWQETGTCFKYLPKNTDFRDSSGTYQVNTPCNEYN